MKTHKLRTNNIRRRPKWQLLLALRAKGITLTTIAETVGVSPSYVSRELARRGSLRPTPKTEEIWAEVEKALA